MVVVVFSLPSIINYARKPAIPAVGEVARQDIIAAIPFDVYKPDSIWRPESLSVIRSVPVVLKYDRSIGDSMISVFDSVWTVIVSALDSQKLSFDDRVRFVGKFFPQLSRQQQEQLVLMKGVRDFGGVVKSALRIAYSEGFVSSNPIPGEEPPELYCIKTGGRENVYSHSLVADDSTILIEVRKYIERQYKNSPQKIELAEAIVKRFLVPNLVPDIEETRKRRKESLSKISKKYFSVKEGEKIVGKYERVDDKTYLKLLWYYKTLERKSLPANIFMKIGAVFGSFVMVLFVVVMFATFIVWKYPAYWNDAKFMLVVGCVLVLVGILSHILKYFGFSVFAFPVLLVPVVVASISDDWLGFISAAACVILETIGFRGDVVFAVSYLLASAILSFRAKNIQFKNLFYRPITYSAIVGIFTVVVLNLVLFGIVDTNLAKFVAEFGVASVISPFLGLLLLPVAEKISGGATIFTLMDLTDLNTVLLKKLAVEAPGTYNHSVLVGNAAAAAAEAIGANPALAKAGGYYHDIGKLVNPQYFEENQTGHNPHRNLSPFESYRIIVSHTTEGVEIGKLHKLPQKILDIIQQHHGTSVVEYFYLKAKGLNPIVTKDEFRYPGPKPQFVEAAVIMICDVVEAALRSRRDLLPESANEIKSFAWKLILDKIEDGQFDEAPISVSDIKKVIDVIVPIYKGVYHSRGVHEKVEERQT
ncbi:HDIG domain-containing protein [bacterium]|nr:HDIG domain-containing protein [bacterium]